MKVVQSSRSPVSKPKNPLFWTKGNKSNLSTIQFLPFSFSLSVSLSLLHTAWVHYNYLLLERSLSLLELFYHHLTLHILEYSLMVHHDTIHSYFHPSLTSLTLDAFRDEMEIIHPYSSSYRGSELYLNQLHKPFTSKQNTVSQQET